MNCMIQDLCVYEKNCDLWCCMYRYTCLVDQGVYCRHGNQVMYGYHGNNVYLVAIVTTLLV
jgi:hypothetical protein